MKKLVAIVVSLALLAVPFTAFASEPEPARIISPKYMSGRIINERMNTIEVYSQMNDSSVVLRISEDTYVIDAVTGGPTDLSRRKNDVVSVYYGPAETRSLPPQSNAVAIICNIPQDFSPLHYTLVEKVEKSSSGIKVTTNDGSLIVAVNNDTPLTHYGSDEKADLNDIDEGSELLLWYAMVAMSYPGQATATKAVVLEKGQAVAETADESADETADKSVTADESAVADESAPAAPMTMVPLRLTAEAQGYELVWDGTTKSVTVSKGALVYRLTVGENKYGDEQLESAPELRDSVMYVPSTFFDNVLSLNS